MIIGIVGKMGSGKDYIATKYILPFMEGVLRKKVLQICFADQIKVNVMSKGNFSYDELYVNKTPDSRRSLQIEGTENGRDVHGKDVWVNYTDSWIKVYKERGINNFIITDCRFKNEVEYIKKSGGIILKVHAPQRNHERLYKESNGDHDTYNKLKGHPSECDLDSYDDNCYDMVIDNDIGDNVLRQITQVYKLISQL
uniref:Deoxynucleoside monophosphate kinase n=1 Tax=viral metagenome TaxID=1070528 RepID=A0A6C0DZN7_9ZZZZ